MTDLAPRHHYTQRLSGRRKEPHDGTSFKAARARGPPTGARVLAPEKGRNKAVIGHAATSSERS